MQQVENPIPQIYAKAANDILQAERLTKPVAADPPIRERKTSTQQLLGT